MFLVHIKSNYEKAFFIFITFIVLEKTVDRQFLVLCILDAIFFWQKIPNTQNNMKMDYISYVFINYCLEFLNKYEKNKIINWTACYMVYVCMSNVYYSNNSLFLRTNECNTKRIKIIPFFLAFLFFVLFP